MARESHGPYNMKVKATLSAKKLLSELWLEPMSYKQFSNLLLGKNKIYDILKNRNGTEDILKKTLIIIDFIFH